MRPPATPPASPAGTPPGTPPATHVDAIAHVILAGGRGRRMGGVDKALLPLGGRPLIAQVAARLGRVDAVSANGDPARLGWLGVPVLPDAQPDLGPLSGVSAALDWAAGRGFAAIVTAAADTPFFPNGLVAQLARHHDATRAPVVVAADRRPDGSLRWQPTFALWSCATAGLVRAALTSGARRIEATARLAGAVAWPVTGPGDFTNINTPDDLLQARQTRDPGAL